MRGCAGHLFERRAEVARGQPPGDGAADARRTERAPERRGRQALPACEGGSGRNGGHAGEARRDARGDAHAHAQQRVNHTRDAGANDRAGAQANAAQRTVFVLRDWLVVAHEIPGRRARGSSRHY